MIAKTCKQCAGDFQVHNYRKDTALYCSRTCLGKATVEAKLEGKQGGKWSDERKKSARIKWNGSGNPNWKGNGVGYFALHNWIKREYGKPTHCEWCFRFATDAKIEWANISDEYKRDREDWMMLCCKCHTGFDMQKKGKPKFRHASAYNKLKRFEKRHGIKVSFNQPWFQLP